MEVGKGRAELGRYIASLGFVAYLLLYLATPSLQCISEDAIIVQPYTRILCLILTCTWDFDIETADADRCEFD
jgi:hypothetical protein